MIGSIVKMFLVGGDGFVFGYSEGNQSLICSRQPLIHVPGIAECVLHIQPVCLLEMKSLRICEHLRDILCSRFEHELHHRKNLPPINECNTEDGMLSLVETTSIANTKAGAIPVLDRLCVEEIGDLIRQIGLTPITRVIGARRRRRRVHLRRARSAAARHFGCN